MKICSICGKPTGWQGTITYIVATGTYTTAGQFGIGDMCLGHVASFVQPIIYQSNSTAIPVKLTSPKPGRAFVPQAFLDAFEEEDLCP